LKRLQKQPKARPFAVEKLANPVVVAQYGAQLKVRLQEAQDAAEVDSKWVRFKTAVTDAAEETVGRRRGTRRERWIQDDTWRLIDERQKVKCRRNQARTVEERAAVDTEYRILDRRVKSHCRADRKRWLEDRANEAQEAASKNDSRKLYRIVRELTGARSSTSGPIRDKNGRLLLTQEEQDARWTEYFCDTLNQPHPATTFDFAHRALPDELDLNTGPISTSETRTAIKKLRNGKAAGLDRIAPELLKRGGPAVERALTDLFNECWLTEAVPRDWRDGAIVKLPKKGNLADCGNWRGITLLSVPGKVFCIVLLRRIQAKVDQLLRDEQAGFRSGRSCSEQIFALRIILEQSLEFQKPLAINFVDFKKAFDSVHRESLWQIARLYGIPQRFINVFQSLYDDSRCCVKTESGATDFFRIDTGVRQGCILSPFLFLLVVDFVMRDATREQQVGIPWTDQTRLTDLDFADDIALLADSYPALQALTTSLEDAAAKVGLRISTEKSKTMRAGIGRQGAQIRVGNQPLEEVPQFTYLGSIVSVGNSADADVASRLGKATSTFQRLQRIWSARSIGTKTKLRLYNSLVLATALYASETWRITARTGRKLDVFHHRCLRRILGISYLDRIANEEVLRRSDSLRLQTMVAKRRLRLAGHILRLPASRPAAAAMQWTPPGGERRRGRPVKTWRSTFQEDLKRLGIAWAEAGTAAADRRRWKSFIAQCA
jgi:hypothetical protein